jgi:RNA polymerase sigma-70 factor (ECF subfamily)
LLWFRVPGWRVLAIIDGAENETFLGKSGFKELSMDEQELIRRVQDGDEEAFGQIMGLYKDKIVNYLYQFSGDYQKAVELAQETFIRVYFKADKYRPIAPLSSWIYTIASNLAKTECRRSRKMATVSLEDIPNNFSSGTYYKDPADPGLVRNLREALGELHPRYRVPVVLKDVEGFSQEEIARIIKRPVGTVKARISRGREQLRKKLEKARDGEPYPAEKEVSENGRA